MDIKEFKILSQSITNLNPNTITIFLNKHPEIKKFVEDIFNGNKRKYCSLNKTFIALYSDLKFGHCKECGKELTYDQMWSKADFCSNKCKLNINNNPFTKKEIKEKIKNTNMERYGVENPMQEKRFVNKIKETLFKHYGVTNVFQLESVKQKIKETNKERYRC